MSFVVRVTALVTPTKRNGDEVMSFVVRVTAQVTPSERNSDEMMSFAVRVTDPKRVGSARGTWDNKSPGHRG